MADTPSIVIVKKFIYRGQREEFSNKYHFSGTTPGSDAAWKTLADAIIAAERPCTTADVTFVRAYGYEAGNELSVAQIDYEAAPLTPVAGNTIANNGTTERETAITVRWRTPERNSRKKWIYLRKYYHGVAASIDRDKLDAGTITAFQTFANKLIDGTLPGGFKYCGPQGAVAGPPEVNKYYTTRELTRRGKRPSR